VCCAVASIFLLLLLLLLHLQKLEYSADILSALKDLQAAAALPKWGCESPEAQAGVKSHSIGSASAQSRLATA
jgi:hypothetical protein